MLIGAAGNFGQALDLFLDFTCELSGRHAQLFEQRRDDAVALREQRPQDMQRLDLLLSEARAHLLGGLHRFLSFHG